MSAEAPRVFQPGTVTLVLGDAAQSVYVGPTRLTMAARVECLGTPAGTTVRFRPASSRHEELTLDEEIRIVVASGIRAIRG